MSYLGRWDGSGEAGVVGRAYRTGGGGYAQAAFLGLGVALLLLLFGFPFFLLLEYALPTLPAGGAAILAAVNPITAPLLAMAVTAIMRERNARAIVNDLGLQIQDWRKVTRFIEWQNVVGMLWRRYRGQWWTHRYSLALVVATREASTREVNVGYCFLRESEDLRKLAEEVATRRDMSVLFHWQTPWWEWCLWRGRVADYLIVWGIPGAMDADWPYRYLKAQIPIPGG